MRTTASAPPSSASSMTNGRRALALCEPPLQLQLLPAGAVVVGRKSHELKEQVLRRHNEKRRMTSTRPVPDSGLHDKRNPIHVTGSSSLLPYVFPTGLRSAGPQKAATQSASVEAYRRSPDIASLRPGNRRWFGRRRCQIWTQRRPIDRDHSPD